MFNLPDTCTPADIDRNQASPEDVLPCDAEDVYSAQTAYREIVRFAVLTFKRLGITHLASEDISWLGFPMGLEDVLHEAVRPQLRNLEEAGFDIDIRGDDHRNFFEEMYATLKGRELRDPLSSAPALAAQGYPAA